MTPIIEWSNIAGTGHWSATVDPLVYLDICVDETGADWSVEVLDCMTAESASPISGECGTLEYAKLSAIAAWREWAKAQAEAAGWRVE